MSEYIFVLDNKGIRQTSYIVGVHGNTIDDVKLFAKQQYPQCELLQGDEEMQSMFMQNKAYVQNKFVDIAAPVHELTKAEKIAEIRSYYNRRFETLDQALIRRRLANGDISDLQEQFKKINTEMIAKIKAVK